MFQIIHPYIIIVIVFCYSTLNAATYDMDLLNTYSKLTPRFILMSTQKNKIDQDINICLSFDEEDERVADEFINYTALNYPDGIKNYKIKFSKIKYKNISLCSDTQLIFLFRTNSKALKKAISFSQDKKIMTIAYDNQLLVEGVDISLFLGRDTKPYINLKSVLDKGIRLDNLLLRISKIYNNKEGSR